MCQNMEGKEKRIETTMTQTGWEYLRPLQRLRYLTQCSLLSIYLDSIIQTHYIKTDCVYFFLTGICFFCTLQTCPLRFNSKNILNAASTKNKIKLVNVVSMCNTNLHYTFYTVLDFFILLTDLCSVAWCWIRPFTVQPSKSFIENTVVKFNSGKIFLA